MRRYVLLLLDVTLLLSATACALLLRENFQVPASRLIDALPYFLATLVAGLIIFPMAGLNRTVWRFIGLPDLLRVTAAVTAAAKDPWINSRRLDWRSLMLSFSHAAPSVSSLLSRSWPIVRGGLAVPFGVAGPDQFAKLRP